MTRILALLMLLAFTPALAEPMETVAVSGINYTERELGSFLFADPNEPKRVAGGMGLRPYEAGGTMCCYSLPKTWRPGIKVKLEYYWWSGSEAVPRTERVFEVPPYAGGRAGMLWAIFYGGDDVEIVSSEYVPGHPDWPGRIKHWPKPSLEYRRKLWQEEWESLQRQKASFERYLQNLSERDWQEEWAYQEERHRDRLHQFRGPDDPAFRAWRKSAYEDAIGDIDREIRLLESTKP